MSTQKSTIVVSPFVQTHLDFEFETTGSILQRNSFNLEIQNNCQVIIKKLGRWDPILVFLDEQMEDCLGEDCLQKIRGNSAFAHISVILVLHSGRSQLPEADACLLQPFSRLEFHDVVLPLLGTSSRHFDRIKVEMTVTFQVSGGTGQPLRGVTRDISEGGVSLVTESELSVGQKIDLKIDLPDGSGTLEALGVIRHVNVSNLATPTCPQKMLGIEFLNLDRRARELLRLHRSKTGET